MYVHVQSYRHICTYMYKERKKMEACKDRWKEN